MNKPKGKLIVIEGVDGCGKTTQFELLKKRLIKEKRKVFQADFPRYYSSTWGRLVGRFLRGELGKFDDTSPYITTLMYMNDEYTWGRDIGNKKINEGYVIVSNRYFTSNVHQIAKLKGPEKIKFRNWMWNAGYEGLGIIKPDLVIFLDVSPEISKGLNKLKKDRKYLNGKTEDEAEKRYYHQLDSYKEYLHTVKTNKNWELIKCVTDNKIDEPNIIHERLWKVVSKYL